MNLITDTWRQLVRRRLWPVALVLIGGIAAVPMLLAKNPAPTAVPPATAVRAEAADDLAKPVVQLAEASNDDRRRVLGASKDPFAPAPLPKAKKSRTPSDGPAAGASPAGTAPPDTGTTPSGGFTPSGDSTVPTSPTPPASVPGTTAPKKPSYPADSLTVRFGDASPSSQGEPASSTLTRLEALPSADDPVLVYLGLENGGKTAVFMVDSSVTVQGDGSCDPDPHDCETLRLHAGETEFLDVPSTTDGPAGGQFELDVVKIHTKRKAGAAKAHKARAKVSKAGRKPARARTASVPQHLDSRHYGLARAGTHS